LHDGAACEQEVPPIESELEESEMDEIIKTVDKVRPARERPRERDRERQRDRDRETERDRDIDRQRQIGRDRQTDRQTDRQRQRQTKTETDKDRQRQTETDRQTGRETAACRRPRPPDAAAHLQDNSGSISEEEFLGPGPPGPVKHP
jgi:hypothetical protein